ncbi:hypothetical protein PORUE0001_0989 [Porphyromonas uenonis 60-3]|uniref:Uncharacterized protein n=1 Tax=Porphyromonas uenonis 60-3 TaxID=596327 RepID=C2MAX8_9PORP|nr:polyprenyl synthetase family protein [Porphyromonas uenonis]EEK17135.1 hypothetical protein PORUE0001_0989 [Porphyromonas uenonis 60-3]
MRDFNKMATLVMEGQQLDLEYERLDNVSKEQYLEMIGYKTAVLIATATRFGANPLKGGYRAGRARL